MSYLTEIKFTKQKFGCFFSHLNVKVTLKGKKRQMDERF